MTDTTFDAFTPAAPVVGTVPIPPPATGGVISDDQVYVPEHPAPFVVPADFVPPPNLDGVQPVPPTVEVAWTTSRGRQYEGDIPADAHVMPSGNWVQLSDPHLLTRGDKRELARKSWAQGTFAERVWISTDLILAKLITAWSYPLPLPSLDLASLEAVPVEDDDAISELIADAQKLLFPDPVTPDDHADPTSPTAPSGE